MQICIMHLIIYRTIHTVFVKDGYWIPVNIIQLCLFNFGTVKRDKSDACSYPLFQNFKKYVSNLSNSVRIKKYSRKENSANKYAVKLHALDPLFYHICCLLFIPNFNVY